MIELIFVIIIFVLISWVFALAAFIPPIRRRACRSAFFRYTLIGSLSAICFIVFFVGLTYIGAVVTIIFSSLGTCDFGGNCYGGAYPFSDDPVFNRLYTQELWIQNMLPPFLAGDNPCFTGDEFVCEQVHMLRRSVGTDYTDTAYLQLLFLSLVPAISCGLMVRYITRDNRKPKMNDV